MMIYLIRHAHAVDGDDDARRPLSDKGRRQIRAMAKFLRRSGRLKTREFWHIPLVRARNTAALLAGDMELDARLSEVAGIEPTPTRRSWLRSSSPSAGPSPWSVMSRT